MKKIFLVIAIGLLAVTAFSQPQQNRHEFSVWAGGGINSLQSTGLAADGQNCIGLGMLGGIGYNFFFNYHWSLGTGAEFSWLNGSIKYNSLGDIYPATSGMAEGGLTPGLFALEISAKDYKESQRAFYINIPLMVKYQVDVYKLHKFYAAAGGKIGIPIDGSSKSESNFTTRIIDLENSDQTHQVYLPGNESRGIGTFSGSRSSDVDFKVNFMLSAEVGMKWKLSNALDLYTGIYFDYGLNEIRKSSDNELNKDLLAYTADGNGNFMGYQTNSLFNSRYYGNNYDYDGLSNGVQGVKYVDKVHTLGLGLKAQLAFGCKPFAKKVKTTEQDEAMAAAIAALKDASDKPFDGLTAAQMADIMAKSNKDMMDFQRKEFDALKELLEKEAPELTQAIINFDLDKHAILPRMYYELDKKVELLNKYPKANMLLQGHTDDIGSMEYNYELGLERAQATKEYLVKKGINPNRLQIESKGKTMPVVPNTDEANRYRNRRVEFILIK